MRIAQAKRRRLSRSMSFEVRRIEGPEIAGLHAANPRPRRVGAPGLHSSGNWPWEQPPDVDSYEVGEEVVFSALAWRRNPGQDGCAAPMRAVMHAFHPRSQDVLRRPRPL